MIFCQTVRPKKTFAQIRCIYHNHRLNDFPLGFQPKDVEKGRYEIWEKNNFFNPQNDKETFRMILPPPNVTGTLHLGHALTATIQDVLARWYRMKGTPVLWVPGLDHAGIATQAVLEKHLSKIKNLSRRDTSRDEFLALIWDWKNEKSHRIKDQLRTLGSTLDWSKEFFTMSKKHSEAVIDAFLILNDRNLIYRGKRLVNWSPALRSTISDIEVEYTEISGKTNVELPGYKRKISFGEIFEIAYDLEDGAGKEKIFVATTRPETIFGDVAIAVHPDDPRYSKFVGRRARHPFMPRSLPIVADESVKMDFGTGAVKITPAHAHLDYEIAMKHGLEIIDAIDEDGKMKLGPFEGLPRYTARHKVLEELARSGALTSTKDHDTVLPRCTRSGDVIEFLIREQWFVKCKNMADRAAEAVKNGTLKLDPDIHEKVWFDWLENVRDWCISRQIWWGHQIPAYKFQTKSGESRWTIARSEEEARRKAEEICGEFSGLERDSDVLDTWFSSALLPFSVMGWPERTSELEKHYPLSLMETGHDIIFFWVARMAMMGLELTNQLPFKEVLLHGVLCDGKGKKMSKSLGNVISPENVINGISSKDLNAQARSSFESGILSESEMKKTLFANSLMFPNGIPECGVDALRFTLCSHNIRNRTVSFNHIECEMNKFFANKIWQASRYTVLMTDDEPIKKPGEFSVIDRWILSRLSHMISVVNENLEKRSFYKATAAIKEFVYYEFCDFYVEGTKRGFLSEQKELVDAHRYTLAKCLEVSLRVISPLMPFLADDLYSRLAKKLSIFSNYESLSQASYPEPKEFESDRDLELERKIDGVLKVILSIRCLVANLDKKSEFKVHIVVDEEEDEKLYNDNFNMIAAVGKVANVEVINSKDYTKRENCVWDVVGKSCCIYLVLEDKVFLEQLKERLKRKRSQIEKKLNNLTKVTSLSSFSNKTEEEKIKYKEQMDDFEQQLKRMPRLG